MSLFLVALNKTDKQDPSRNLMGLEVYTIWGKRSCPMGEAPSSRKNDSLMTRRSFYKLASGSVFQTLFSSSTLIISRARLHRTSLYHNTNSDTAPSWHTRRWQYSWKTSCTWMASNNSTWHSCESNKYTLLNSTFCGQDPSNI